MTSRPTNPLVLPAVAVDRLIAEVRTHGAHGVETGAFLLTPLGGVQVSALALSGVLGVHRSPDLFRIEAEVIQALFEWAVAQRLQVRSLVHSHRGDAFLSLTDRREGFAVPGFLSAVIPDFAAPPSDVSRWGWWVYEEADWRSVPPPATGRHRPRVVSFDRSGVRGA